MATAKKPAKKAPAKKTTIKRAPSKSTVKTKLKVQRVDADAKMKSFRPYKVDNFMSWKVTRQTFYWLLLSTLWLGIGLWILDMVFKINGIYSSIGV